MKKYVPLLIVAGIAFIILILFGKSMFIVLKPGERGVMFRQFAEEPLDKENIYKEGFHVMAPWNEMIVYDVREQQREETMDILAKNGLSVSVDVTVRFYPDFSKVGNLHETFGPEYVNRLVIPELRSSVRKVMGRYLAEEIYSTQRQRVEDEIYNETKQVLNNNYIIMTALLIRSINLPAEIKQAIESKLKQEQEALAYQFRLEREKSEAERKVIEAEGTAKANNIINNSLTDKLLKMRGIEATLQLSQSPNSKVVIVGSSKDGLPIILGNN
ncbi:MAG: prohibitin family protein [Bacteroidia bacterium]|nr:prohibitin family protein [Bacteroidia bacterium]